ncbi:MAG: hypothetical protein H0T45_09980 [Pyrinomonadaceae bacterium]|nr:hypothetical protein [Pyrinomonadaceae bacterium]MDQ3133337.1 hypothetical protein [Acidobacteriota bacterium]
MRVKFVTLFLAGMCVAFANGTWSVVEAQQYNHREVEPKLTTLLSQIRHKDFAKANFNFKLGVRGDSDSPPTRNVYDLRYGGLSYDHDNDLFDVPIAHGSRSQIIDLGASDWADVYNIPFLYASPEPHGGMRTDSFHNGKVIKSTPENTLVKAIVGHMYLLHAKDNGRDLYAMFRVESLKSGDEATISWKIVPSPESK